MSKSFDVNVSFNFRAVFRDDDLAQLQQAIDQARSEKPVSRYAEWLLATVEEEGLEGAMRACIKDCVKQMKDAVLAEAPTRNFKNFSPFTATITPRIQLPKPQVACVVPDPACDCSFCRGF